MADWLSIFAPTAAEGGGGLAAWLGARERAQKQVAQNRTLVTGLGEMAKTNPALQTLANMAASNPGLAPELWEVAVGQFPEMFKEQRQVQALKQLGPLLGLTAPQGAPSAPAGSGPSSVAAAAPGAAPTMGISEADKARIRSLPMAEQAKAIERLMAGGAAGGAGPEPAAPEQVQIDALNRQIDDLGRRRTALAALAPTMGMEPGAIESSFQSQIGNLERQRDQLQRQIERRNYARFAQSLKPPPRPMALRFKDRVSFDPARGRFVSYRDTIDPSSGRVLSSEFEGIKLTGPEQQAVTDAATALQNMPEALQTSAKLQQRMAAMTPAQQRIALDTQWAHYNAANMSYLNPTRYLAGMTAPDPDFANYFTAMSAMRQQLGAALKAFRSVKLWSDLSPHLPEATALPQVNQERLNFLSKGRLRRAIDSVSTVAPPEAPTAEIGIPPESGPALPPEPSSVPDPAEY